jgi:hypothetical protein
MSRDGTPRNAPPSPRENWKECDKDECKRAAKPLKFCPVFFNEKRRAKT